MELGPRHVPSWGLWLRPELCLGQKVPWGGWVGQGQGSEEGSRLPAALPCRSQTALGILRRAPVPGSLCLGGNKGAVVDDPGSGLHADGSAPTDPCRSPRGPDVAWVWDRWSQKGPFCDARGWPGTAPFPSTPPLCCLSALCRQHTSERWA